MATADIWEHHLFMTTTGDGLQAAELPDDEEVEYRIDPVLGKIPDPGTVSGSGKPGSGIGPAGPGAPRYSRGDV
jgi:hypothetical protein